MKGFLFWLGAVTAGVLGVLLLEGVLRILGWGRPQAGADAFVTFSEMAPLFEGSLRSGCG
ncbi:MAG: hypothetical protein M2R45_03342 [Verrucomicrobia subdivision 3 bacterium]|nr:hypothetical protein [Limisphaerales bacterium]MCS1415376.1 hypothetical protein [Limisphaerales bacterium]